MNTTIHESSDTGQDPPEHEKLLKVIRNWVGKNKKIFWKYEVACFYKTYIMRITNLPEPSTDDILLSVNNRMLSDKQKKELSSAIARSCARAKAFYNSTIDVQINYDNGVVFTEILRLKQI